MSAIEREIATKTTIEVRKISNDTDLSEASVWMTKGMSVNINGWEIRLDQFDAQTFCLAITLEGCYDILYKLALGRKYKITDAGIRFSATERAYGPISLIELSLDGVNTINDLDLDAPFIDLISTYED